MSFRVAKRAHHDASEGSSTASQAPSAAAAAEEPSLLQGDRAFVTHDSFIDLELTRKMLQQRSSTTAVAYTFLAQFSREKFSLLPQAAVAPHVDRYGHHTLANLHVLDNAR